jgi:hypothetical protein
MPSLPACETVAFLSKSRFNRLATMHPCWSHSGSQ